ncbi:CAP domain-containing protein [Sphingomonas sp.]|uniref:CAP domain-containing protein n=1 Tax=Sphingomonas sp. TaxID=28214 RepID=UPI003CC5CDBB
MGIRLGGAAVAVMVGCWASAGSAAAVDGDGIEAAVLAQLNYVRAHPQEVAAALRRYRQGFAGRVVHEDGDPVGTETFEGTPAVDEAIAFLDAQPPLPPLQFSPVLARAAQGWAAAQGPAGATGHISAAGATPGTRVRAAGGDIYVGETISYGMRAGETVVRQFIVDDGQPRRGHRALVFSTSIRFAGVGCGGHARYGAMCVIDYAATPDGSPVLPQVAALQPSRASAFSR